MSIIAKTRESTTLQLLLVPLIAVTYKYLGTDLVTTSQYAQAFALLMAVWLGREWRSAHYKETP